MNITTSSKADPQQVQYLQSISKGNKITQSKEFKLVFFITCFVPFIRPNVPMIKATELNALKLQQKESLKRKKKIMGGSNKQGA